MEPGLSAVEHHNQRLYDSAAGTTQDLGEARRVRAEGAALPLKNFHNTIKRALLLKFATQCPRLFDIGVGRGGDIAKWLDARVLYVKGVDLSAESIKEAQDRLRHYTCDKSGKRKRGINMVVELVADGGFGTREYRDKPYDCMVSMFTLHYFFCAEQTLRTLLHNVSANLKLNGVFFGCVPDGIRVLELLKDKTEFHSPFLHICKKFEGERACFGSAYTCSIGDTVTEGQGEGSLEFLVFGSVLTQLAAKYGLEPILDYGTLVIPSRSRDLEGKTWAHLLDLEKDRDSVFKHFNPRFPGSDPSLETCSRMFCAFAFRKVWDYPKPPPARGPGTGSGAEVKTAESE